MFHFFPESSFARNYFNLPEIFNCQINGAHIQKKEFIQVAQYYIDSQRLPMPPKKNLSSI